MAERKSLPPDVTDEILCGVSLLPLARANLRAPLRAAISITDASERGRAAAEASSFKPSLSTFFGEQVSEQKSALNEQLARKREKPQQLYCGVCTAACSGSAVCGPGCGTRLCSFECYKIHRARSCPRIFNARFSVGLCAIGIDPGWGWTLLCSKLEVELMPIESRSLSLPSVSVVSLHDAALFRTDARRDQSQGRMRIVRNKVRGVCKFLRFLLASERNFVVLHPHVSLIWTFKEWEQLIDLVGVVCTQTGSVGEIWAVHNFTHAVNLPGVGIEGRGVAPVCIKDCVQRFVIPELNLSGGQAFPDLHADRSIWIYNQLINSTRGLSHDINSTTATRQILSWLDEMAPGSEEAHLNSLYRVIDLRGSDVRLDISSVLITGRQTMPYPAFAWEWSSVQSYTWATHQHINVLELIAFFNYLRGVICRFEFQSVRFFHVLDSMVASSVVSKGRSSSKILNRTLRRVAGLCLGGDL